jgi:DNA adenine methylase Dam
MRTFLKYTGSKAAVAKELSTYFPQHGKFVDLFVGGGSILLQSTKPKLINDINPHVIETYKLVKNTCPNTIIDKYIEWRDKIAADVKEYYTLRNKFNTDFNALDYLFLTRFCYNGLSRFNAKGQFNVAHHFDRKGMEPKMFLCILEYWHNYLQNAEIYNRHYYDLLDKLDSNCFVFLDPPYLKTNGQYLANVKTFDYKELIQFLYELTFKNIKFMLCLDQDLPESFLPAHLGRMVTVKAYNSSLSRLKGRTSKVADSIFINYEN